MSRRPLSHTCFALGALGASACSWGAAATPGAREEMASTPGHLRTHAALVDGGNDADAAPFPEPSIEISPLPLTPSFAPDVHDYSVRCAAGMNALTVSMTAPAGGSVGLLQPEVTEPMATGSVSVSVAENAAIVVGMTTGATTEQYWIRCLPHDFPPLYMRQWLDAPERPSPGYYLVGGVLAVSDAGGYAIVLDGNGVPVWYHTAAGDLDAIDVDVLTPGVVSFVPYIEFTFSTVSTEFELHDLAGATTYTESVGEPVDIHELRVLPNGDYLVLAIPITTGVDLTGLASFGANENLVGCDIQEVTPAGAVVWTWRAVDHFDTVLDSTWPQVTPVAGTTVVDAYHCNSIDVDANGDLLVSARHMDSVFLVSKATGAILWKMGGSAYTKDGAPYIAVAGGQSNSFFRQHDARFLPDGDLSLFDDETDTPNPARAVIYSLDVAARQATMVWQFAATTSSLSMGSFRVMPDGSRIIGWGVVGWAVGVTPSPTFTEVDAAGNILRELTFPDGNASYRAVKVPTSELSIDLMRATAGAAGP